MAIPMQYRNLTWRIHEASERLQENHDRQRAIIHGQNRRQLQVEREVLMSRIHAVPAGLRKVFLAARLEHLKKQLQ